MKPEAREILAAPDGYLDLTIVSVVEDNSLGLADLMINSVNKHTNHHSIIIIDNSGNNANLNKYPNVKVIDNALGVKGLIGGSNRHGCGINLGIKQSNTKYTAILDSDVVVFPNWFSSKIAIPKTPTTFHMCLLLDKTETLNKIDFRPGKIRHSAISYKPEEDVGWAYTTTPTEHKLVECKTGGTIFKGIQCDEISINNRLIATHFGRGSNIKGKANIGLATHEIQLNKWKELVGN